MLGQTLTESERAAWYDVLGKFRQRAAEFERSFQDLLAQSAFVQTQSPQVRAEYDALVRKGSETYTRVHQIRQALADVEAALRGAWDFVTGAWQKIAGAVGLSGLGGLGLAPLIPIAAVTAAIATLGYFLSDYAKFKSKLDELRRLEARGMTPAQAAEVLTTVEGPGLFGRIPWIPILLIGAAMMFLPALLKGMKR